VSIPVDDDQMVTITGTLFDGSEPRTLRFGPAPPGKVIDVHLTNLCCGGYQDEDPNAVPKEGDDFECFYILCQNFERVEAISTLARDDRFAAFRNSLGRDFYDVFGQGFALNENEVRLVDR
jgi:hypothetical protein